MGANMFELMVVVALAIILSSNQFSNFILERSKGIATVDQETLAYYGGKLIDICNDTNGQCDGVATLTNLPANSPAVASINAAQNAYWSGPPGSVLEPISQQPFALVWATAPSGMSAQSVFVLVDQQPFLPEEIPDINTYGTVTPSTKLYLKYDSCVHQVYADSNTAAAAQPKC